MPNVVAPRLYKRLQHDSDPNSVGVSLRSHTKFAVKGSTVMSKLVSRIASLPLLVAVLAIGAGAFAPPAAFGCGGSSTGGNCRMAPAPPGLPLLDRFCLLVDSLDVLLP